MEISFRTQNNIQVVVISGTLGEVEAAAVRVKLEQKINQGRDRVLFDVTGSDLENSSSRQLLLGILSYCVNRGILVSCCGVQASQHPLLILPGNKQIKMFYTSNEGLDYLSKNEPPKPRIVDHGKKTEEELKGEALGRILEKYEVFQQNDDDDQFRLKFLAEQYRTNPNREALVIERKALEAFNNAQAEIKILDADCDQMSEKVKSLMLNRKVPLSPKELQLKQNALVREIEELKSGILAVKGQISQHKSEIESLKKEAGDYLGSLDQAIKDYEKKVAMASESYSRELKSLKAQDAQEQADFEAKVRSY